MGKNILLTGATGNMGAYAAREFIKEGSSVFAIARSRNRKKGMAARRMKRSVLSFGGFEREYDQAVLDNKFTTIDVDIADADALSQLKLDYKIDETWHFASSLKYLPNDNDELYQVNIASLNSMIDLHKRHSHDDSRFYYISTAYIGGKTMSAVKEENLVINNEMQFNNEYERTKLIAENTVMGKIASGEIKGNIFRPSIVVGDRATGSLVNYNGYYLAIKLAVEMKKYFASKKGDLQQLRIHVNKEGAINLIHIDDATDLMLKIRNAGPKNGDIFNIVNGKETKLQSIFEVIGKQVGYDILLCNGEDFAVKPKNRYEKLAYYGMTYIMPYVNQKISFETSNVDKVIGEPFVFDMIPQIYKINDKYINQKH